MILSETYKKRLQELAGIRSSKEIEDIDEKTELYVFDFDGTLVDTPLPEEGKLIWKEKTGKDWEGGWFSEPESLNTDVFDMPTFPDVISAYNKIDSDPNVLRVMLTGRIQVLHKYVKDILDSKGLRFDDYLYNDGGETSQNKRNHIEMILKYNPNIREVVIFDDRDEHIPVFQEWGDDLVEQGLLDNFKINHVHSNRH